MPGEKSSMAKSDNRKRGEVPEAPKWSNEVIGIILICAGLLAFLSVISYTPKDLPKWGLLEAFAQDRAPGEPRHNFIGIVGALLGFAQVSLFGSAGYIVPVALIWFGVAKLVFDARLWPRTMIGFAVLTLSGAAFMHALRGVPGDFTGPGGVTGYLLGEFLFLRLIGKVGSLILLGSTYLIALILLTGQKPVGFIKGCSRMIANFIARFRERREESQIEASKDELRAAERERERERRRKDREAAKAAEPPPNPQQELPLRETPAPQIIDSSQRRVEAPKPGERPFERKQQPAGHLSLSTAGFEDYDLPGFDLLDAPSEEAAPEANRDELLATQRIIVDTLRAFGIEVTPGDITRGPTITRYEIYPSTGLRVSRISQLEADLARATCAERINILAPIPGKDTVGIELANSTKVSVPLRELLQDPEFRSAKKKIPLALGKDVYGKTVIGDLAAMPHLLVAGATGSGKSVCINSIIASILFKFGPDELRFIMVDPKVVEMQMYNKLPHLVVPVVTDPKKVVAALKWVVNEMEKRYRVFAKTGVRNFDAFNARVRPEKAEAAVEAEEEAPPWNADEEVDMESIESIAAALESGELGSEAEEDELPIEEDKIPDRYPYIVVLIDELADLMQTARKRRAPTWSPASSRRTSLAALPSRFRPPSTPASSSTPREPTNSLAKATCSTCRQVPRNSNAHREPSFPTRKWSAWSNIALRKPRRISKAISSAPSTTAVMKETRKTTFHPPTKSLSCAASKSRGRSRSAARPSSSVACASATRGRPAWSTSSKPAASSVPATARSRAKCI